MCAYVHVHVRVCVCKVDSVPQCFVQKVGYALGFPTGPTLYNLAFHPQALLALLTNILYLVPCNVYQWHQVLDLSCLKEILYTYMYMYMCLHLYMLG